MVMIPMTIMKRGLERMLLWHLKLRRRMSAITGLGTLTPLLLSVQIIAPTQRDASTCTQNMMQMKEFVTLVPNHSMLSLTYIMVMVMGKVIIWVAGLRNK